MTKMKTFVLASAAPALLFAGAADAAATRSSSALPVGVGADDVCVVKVDAQGRPVVTPWQRTHCADLAKAAAGDVAKGRGFLGMGGGGGVVVVGGIVAAGLGVGIAAGGNNSPGG